MGLVEVDGKKLTITGKLLRTVRIEEEWYEDIEDPGYLVKCLRDSRVRADIFTFWQRLPEIKSKFDYHMEWDSIAALPIKSFDYWWGKQIDAKTRNVVRKAEKKGVKIKITTFDDNFVKGMTEIFNETPVRQGKPFLHYGKDFETVKREFSRYLFREDLIGAYFDDELIGFIMLANAGRYAITSEILSKIKHLDKAPNNALIAKAVEICGQKEISYLVYAKWVSGTLGDFKQNNGFKKIDLPRYYIPLTIKGKLALELNLHHGLVKLLPENLKARLINMRTRYYSKKLDLNRIGKCHQL